MANTYTQIFLHCVFAVKKGNALINPRWENQFFAYINGVITKTGHKLREINGMPDHVHLLMDIRPTAALSDIIREVKSESSRWVNENRLTNEPFRWQEGFGAFSCSPSKLTVVHQYIRNQKIHHQKAAFVDEYKLLLLKNGVENNPLYVFMEPE